MSQQSDLLSSTFRSEHWLFNKERFDRDLVADFLFLYSRAEYALKVAKFVKTVPSEPERADWPKFIAALPPEPKVTRDPSLEKAIFYLTKFRPRSLLWAADERLEWEERKQSFSKNRTASLMQAVCDVRNNLFHGGKVLVGRLEERDTRLIDSAIVVLHWALRIKENVWAIFDEQSPYAGPEGSRGRGP